MADRQSQLLGCESDVQFRTDNMRRTSVAGKKRKEKEGGYAVSARLPVYRVGDEQPPEIRWPSEHGYGDFCSLRIAYRVYSSR